MRKIIFFILCLAITVTALLMTVSAASYSFGTIAAPIEEIPQNHIFGDEAHGTGEHNDGWYLSNDGVTLNQDVAKVKLKYTKNGTTTTVTYPTYYIIANDSTLNWDFEHVSAYLGVELNVGNIVAIEIPYGITRIPTKAFVLPGKFVEPENTEQYTKDGKKLADHPRGYVGTANTALEYVFISNTVFNIDDFAFAHCINLATFGSNSLPTDTEDGQPVMGMHNHQMLQSIGYRAFHDCEKITAFNFNKHLVYLGEGAFQGCSLKEINLTKCIELRVIPAYCFHESNAGQIKNILLSNSVEEIGDYAFTGASATNIFLGTDVKKIGHGAIDMNKAKNLILPVALEEIYDDSIQIGANSYVAIIAGAKNQDEVAAVLKVVREAGLNLKHDDKPNKIWDNTQNFFDGTFCIDYLGGHTVDHDSTTIKSVSYPYGIDHEGYALGSCGVCQQMLNTEVTISPIIIAKGFSICTYNGLDAFTNGFEVYHDALNVYEAMYGEVELGILFLLDQKYNTNYDLYKDINKMGVCLTYLVKNETVSFTAMDYVMTYSKGLVYEVVDAQGNVTVVDRGSVPVVIAAYLCHKDSTKAGNLAGTSYYVQDKDDLCVAGTTTDGKYVTVSYNSIYGYVRSMSEDDHEISYEMAE